MPFVFQKSTLTEEIMLSFFEDKRPEQGLASYLSCAKLALLFLFSVLNTKNGFSKSSSKKSNEE